MPLAPVEEKMWEVSPSQSQSKLSKDEINEIYESKEKRIVTEINRERLPSFVESLKSQKYMDIRPFYQRRERWDEKKKSRLIESFLINIPIPPIVLFEKNYASYEVMDGQQRITAIRDFYANKFKLKGLTIWSSLNGYSYDELPPKIRSGIDRRSISSIIIVAESTSNAEDALFLKQETFERLNTGGVDLSKQEVRNCLYSGEFNDLILELSRHPIFAEAWGIPISEDDSALKENTLYKKMEDAELVLRFFAFRNIEHFSGGMKKFLDLYMMKSVNFSGEDIRILRHTFLQTIEIAFQIYGEHLFKPFNPESESWGGKPLKACYDAVMVGVSRHLDRSEELITQKDQIIEATKALFKIDRANLFTGAVRAKADLQDRIKIFDEMLLQVIGV